MKAKVLCAKHFTNTYRPDKAKHLYHIPLHHTLGTHFSGLSRVFFVLLCNCLCNCKKNMYFSLCFARLFVSLHTNW